MNRRCGWSVVALGLTTLCLLAGCHRNISGSYLAKDPNTVCWLQLVRTPDNVVGSLGATPAGNHVRIRNPAKGLRYALWKPR
jgi:hypothetical protein